MRKIGRFLYIHLIALNDDFDELETIVSDISHSITTNDPFIICIKSTYQATAYQRS